MPKGLLQGGGGASPVERQLAEAVRDAKAVGVVRALQPSPTDPLASLSTALDVLNKFRAATETPAKELDDVEKALKRAADAIAVKHLEPDAAPHTAHEMLDMARAAVEIHQGAAQTALAQEEAERARRQEAEESAGAQASYARQDEANKWATLLTVTKESNGTVLSLMERLFSQQLSTQQTQFQQTLAQINEKLDATREAFTQRLEAERQLHAQELSQREKEEQWKLERLKLTQELQAAPRAASPQDTLNQIWAQAEGKKLLVGAEEYEAEAKAKRERAEIVNEVLDTVRENTGPVLRAIANLGGASTGAPRNGIPATLPPAPAEGIA